MRKLIESTFVTTDGVVGEPHKWGGPYWDDEHTAYASDLLFASDALLLGRETYTGFAEVWPTRPADDPYTAHINAIPKYVASRTLTPQDATWNATILQGDVVEAVRTLKAETGGKILKFGTGALSHTLLKAELVDE
ncbi:dihydrofolate reductase family protein [Nocardia crassostreae]|uniref:dihydrofolate reductase family protein n=1 Tax=Nocardia crassostreae TaxID=53428 RepID=UPI000B0A7DDC|nr:dihydrofolate reductase family protein [Nocardia crassostreae]